MGKIKKIGSDYYIEFIARGLRYQRIGGRTKRAAEILLKSIEDQIQEGELSTIVVDVAAKIFFDEFLNYAQQCHYPLTFRRYQKTVRHFQEFCASELSKNFKLSKVTPSVIESYRVSLVKQFEDSSRAIKPKVVNFTLILLRDVLDFAINLGYLNDNPTGHTRFVDAPHSKAPQTLNVQTCENLLKTRDSQLSDIIQLLLKTGMRIEELVSLQWSEVDFKNNCIRVISPKEYADGNKHYRHIPVDIVSGKILRRLQGLSRKEYVFVGPDGQKIDRAQVMNDCVHLAQEQGIKTQAFFPILRNTFVKDVLTRGVSLVKLYQILGLTDIAKIMRYFEFGQIK